MLVLTRRERESIMIGDEIEIIVMELDGDRKEVRIGIQAPSTIKVYRKEINERIKQEKIDQKYDEQENIKESLK